MMNYYYLCIACVFLVIAGVPPLWAASRPSDYVVCLKESISDSRQVEELARSLGFQSQGEVIADSGCYHFFISRDGGGQKLPSKRMLKKLSSDHRVSSVMKQGSNKRQKRDFIPLQYPLEVHKSDPHRHLARKKRGFFSSSTTKTARAPLSDPYWKHMWYLNREGKLNMNVQGAWGQGISGRGVAVTILDDGIEKDHPDLIENYDPLASTDINDNDSDPNPRYDFSDSNRHGTRCAGQVGGK